MLQVVRVVVEHAGRYKDSRDTRYKLLGDLDPKSFWLVTTPSAVQLEQPYLCTEAGTLYGRKHFLAERQGKDSHLLFYTFGGAGQVRQAGLSATVSHGHALLLDCRSPQSYGTAPEADHWHHFWAHIEGAGVESAAKRLGLPAPVSPPVSRTRVAPHFETIFSRLESESVENTELVGITVHTLLSELIMAKARAEVPEDDPVTIVCAFVAKHFDERLSIEDMAQEANVSPSYLTRLFRQTIGTSPHDYLMRHRITRAKQLLAETDLAIGDIAKKTGFGSAGNFSHRFSTIADIRPRAYRKLTRGEARLSPS